MFSLKNHTLDGSVFSADQEVPLHRLFVSVLGEFQLPQQAWSVNCSLLFPVDPFGPNTIDPVPRKTEEQTDVFGPCGRGVRPLDFKKPCLKVGGAWWALMRCVCETTEGLSESGLETVFHLVIGDSAGVVLPGGWVGCFVMS